MPHRGPCGSIRLIARGGLLFAGIRLLFAIGIFASSAASALSQAPTLQPRGPGLQPVISSPQPPSDDGRWKLLNGPPARSQHTALWDAAGEQMLVFGGASGNRPSDMWSYRPATDRWSQVADAVPGRVGLPGQSAVWDPARGQFLVYGGLGPGEGGDLWSFRPNTRSWVDLDPAGVRPTSRAFHSAVWDDRHDQMLVF